MRLDRAGADVMEIGVPFSDPLADGPVIQRATERAIAAGTTLVKVLGIVSDVRSLVNAPIVIFSYANPILRMGLDEFVHRAKKAGVDGVLTLDVPPEEAEQFRGALSKAGIDTIFLLSPTTTVERIRRAAALGTGFLYGISRLGVTGARDDVAIVGAGAGRPRAGRDGHAAGARVRLLAPRTRARGVGVRGCRGRRQRAGQRHRRAWAIGGSPRRSGAVRAMAEELSLEALRDEIDKIDEVIVRLLDSRARCAYAIGRVKKDAGPRRSTSRSAKPASSPA